MRRAPARRVRVCFVRSCCSVVDQEHDLRTTLAQCNAKQALSSHFTLHSSHFTLALHLNSSHLSSSHLISCLPICQLSSSWLFSCQLLPSTDVYNKSLHKLLPSTTLYYKACTNYFPVYTTLYNKACTKHFPVLLCTTKLAQATSQYYFVLQSLHKALPSTTVYDKACTNYFPVLLCTTISTPL